MPAAFGPAMKFDLLAALGADLPGAVRIVPSEGASALFNAPSRRTESPVFSCWGADEALCDQEYGQGGGLTLPLGDEQGLYIAKFPSTSFPGVSENEYANLALAEAIGMDVPERELVDQSEFEGIPKEFETLSDGKVLLIKRFDRGTERRGSISRTLRRCSAFIPSRKYEVRPITISLRL